MQLRFRHVSLFVLLGSFTALASSCSGPGNTGRTPIPDSLVAQVPWTSGHAPLLDDSGHPVIPTTPQYPSIATGMPDPGPQRDADCSALDDLEFSSTFWFDTFEPQGDSNWGAGQAYAYYDDKSEGSFTAPGGFNWYSGLVSPSGTFWGMPADRITRGPACDGLPNEWAMHFKGGRYNRFGAGLEHPISFLERYIEEPCNPEWGVCPPEPAEGAEKDAAGLPLRREDGSNLAQNKFFWNLSDWDGVSFWARRGPEGQGSMSLVLFDKHTSDALNREVDTYCRRIKPCRTECINREECSLDRSGTYRCFNPDEMPQHPSELGLAPAQLEMLYPPCGETACTSASDYLDPQFDGKECQPFTFDTHESAEFCFDEDDQDPPSSGARCGDGYSKPVTVSTEWQFYKIPFSEMRQQGFGKVSPEMDLTSVNQLSFIFFVGWVDTYLDNISLYREKD